MAMRFGELFAGAGGLSLGLTRAGWECAFHAEIDAGARNTLKVRHPDVPLYGDVTTLDAAEILRDCGPIDLLSGGSPCQDLSMAGRRAGIIDGDRSNLFFTQMDLWRSLGAEYCLWENVPGALSSGKGEDFRYVLSAFVGADVGRPTDRKGNAVRWANAGVVCGPEGVAAWRVLDAQYWGVPQRRRRVFVLGTRTGIIDPLEILSEFEGVSWHPAPGDPSWEDLAEGAGVRATSPSGAEGRGAGAARDVISLDIYNQQASEGVTHTLCGRGDTKGGNAHLVPAVVSVTTREDTRVLSFYSTAGSRGVSAKEGTAPPIKVGSGIGIASPPAVLAYAVRTAQTGANGIGVADDKAHTLDGANGQAVLTFYAGNGAKAHGIGLTQDVSAPLKAEASGNNQVPTVLTFYHTNRQPEHGNNVNICSTIKVGSGKGGNPPACVVYDARGNGDGAVVNTITGDHNCRVTDFTAIVCDTTHTSVVPLLEVGKRTGTSTTDPRCGIGIGKDGDPMYTLQAGAQHGVIAYSVSENQRAEVRLTEEAPTLNLGGGKPGEGMPVVLSTDTPLTAEERHWRQPEATVARMQAFGQYEEDGTASCIKARDYKDATDIVYTWAPDVAGTIGNNRDGSFGFEMDNNGAFPITVGIPRRLLPLECERLMAWPDAWTLVPDDKGKLASDAARYRQIGNGVVSHCVQFIGERLLAAHLVAMALEQPLEQAA